MGSRSQAPPTIHDGEGSPPLGRVLEAALELRGLLTRDHDLLAAIGLEVTRWIEQVDTTLENGGVPVGVLDAVTRAPVVETRPRP